MKTKTKKSAKSSAKSSAAKPRSRRPLMMKPRPARTFSWDGQSFATRREVEDAIQGMCADYLCDGSVGSVVTSDGSLFNIGIRATLFYVGKAENLDAGADANEETS